MPLLSRGLVTTVAFALACAGCGTTADGETRGGGGPAGGGTGGSSGDGGSGVPMGGGWVGGAAGTSAGGTSGGAGGTNAAGGSTSSGGTATAGGTGGTGGVGGGCNPQPETCNNQDDNCNGAIDEGVTQSCSTMCGTGLETCTAGQFSACSAQQPNSCQNYATCTMEPQCVSTCPSAPTESCNLSDDDCDGQCDEGGNCRTAVNRSFAGSLGHRYNPDATKASCCGYVVEHSDYFYLYDNNSAGLKPFYECDKGGNRFFYTTSSNCEVLGASANRGSIGHIGDTNACGAKPLIRMYNAQNGRHLYVTSAAEKANAAGLGYVEESIAGYVWSSP